MVTIRIFSVQQQSLVLRFKFGWTSSDLLPPLHSALSPRVCFGSLPTSSSPAIQAHWQGGSQQALTDQFSYISDTDELSVSRAHCPALDYRASASEHIKTWSSCFPLIDVDPIIACSLETWLLYVCTDCKAPWGKLWFVILGYINKNWPDLNLPFLESHQWLIETGHELGN